MAFQSDAFQNDTFRTLPPQLLTGALSFAGTVVRSESKLHSGALSFSGVVLKSLPRAIAGIASFSGAIAKSKIQFKSLTAGLSFAGSFVGAAKKAVTGALSFSGAILRYTPRVVAGALSFSGSVQRIAVRANTGIVTFAGGVATSLTHRLFFTSSLSFSGLLKTLRQWLQVQLAILEKPILLAIREQPIREVPKPQWQANIQVKGPIEMAYKRGTNVLFEATFTDKDGNNYDPDVGTAKLYAKKPDGTYLTGYDPAVGGRLMTQISTGVYQADLQLQRTDLVGQWEIEVEGYVGTKRSLDSLKIQVRA